jgi:predicted nucleotidyltransferase
MLTTQEVITKLQESKTLLTNKYPIRSLAIFGSHARNEQVEDSDVDILVEFDEKIGLRFIDLADELELLLGRRIDLVSKGGIKEKYYQSIKQDLIYV